MVIGNDDLIDGRYLEVHQGLLSLFALQAPVAGDLRIVAAMLHVMKNIERMGDQCVNIAKTIPLTGHEPPVREEVLERILRMGRAARTEVTQAKTAFATRDVALAEDLVRQDQCINLLNREIFQLAIDWGPTPTRASGPCTWSWSRGRSSASATTRSTSASRRRSSSPGCFASFRTLRTRAAGLTPRADF